MAKDKQAKDDGAKGKSKGAKGKTAKDKAGGKDRGAGGKSKNAPDAATAGPSLSLAAHPRAARRVAEAKAWGGLGGFLLGGYLSLASHSLFETALRALVAGAVCYVAVWAIAVFLWRRLIVAELRHVQHEMVARRLARLQGAGPADAGADEPGPRASQPAQAQAAVR